MTLKQNWTDKDVITATFLNELVAKVNAGGGSSTVDGLTDASALGKSLAKAANAAAARTAIGAMAKAEADANYASTSQGAKADTAVQPDSAVAFTGNVSVSALKGLSANRLGVGAGIGAPRVPAYLNLLVSGDAPNMEHPTTPSTLNYVGLQVNVTHEGDFARLNPPCIVDTVESSPTITLASGEWPELMEVGWWTHIPGAGSGGGTLRGKITAITSTTITLDIEASITLNDVASTVSVSMDPKYTFSGNFFGKTGSAAGDLDGVKIVYGWLSEMHLYSPGVSLDSILGASSELALESGATGTVGLARAHHVKTVYNKTGGALSVTSAYGLYVEPTTPESAGATNAWSLYVGGGLSQLSGRVKIAGVDSSDVPLTVRSPLGATSSDAAIQVRDITETNRNFIVRHSGAIGSASGVTVFEGNASGQVYIGLQTGSYPGIAFHTSNDVRWARTGAGVMRFVAGKSSALPNVATGDRATASAAGLGGVCVDTTTGDVLISDGTDWRILADISALATA